jgi:hypothetical protein
LRRSITSKEAVGSHPPRLHDFRLKKREHHVATAKHRQSMPRPAFGVLLVGLPMIVASIDSQGLALLDAFYRSGALGTG